MVTKRKAPSASSVPVLQRMVTRNNGVRRVPPTKSAPAALESIDIPNARKRKAASTASVPAKKRVGTQNNGIGRVPPTKSKPTPVQLANVTSAAKRKASATATMPAKKDDGTRRNGIGKVPPSKPASAPLRSIDVPTATKPTAHPPIRGTKTTAEYIVIEDDDDKSEDESEEESEDDESLSDDTSSSDDSAIEYLGPDNEVKCKEILIRSINTAPSSRIRRVLRNIVSGSGTAAQIAGYSFLHKKKGRVAKAYEICKNCEEEYHVGDNDEDACAFHPGRSNPLAANSCLEDLEASHCNNVSQADNYFIRSRRLPP